MNHIVIIGGTQGTGRALARACASMGDSVVIAGRDRTSAEAAAAELRAALPAGAGAVHGIAADLSAPHGLRQALSGLGSVKHLVIAGVARDHNSLAEYDIDKAIGLATLKLVGYAAAVAELRGRMAPGASVLLFGGLSKDRPYPGSTTISSVNAGIVGMVNTMARELRPMRVNSIHPGMIADSPHWIGNQAMQEFGRSATLSGVLPRMQDVVDGCLFLLNNQAANGVNLSLDGGLI